MHSAKPPGEVAVELLVEAGAVLASSLDLATTMSQVARLTVPRLADLCVIDMLEDDGSIKKMAVAADDERLIDEISELREREQVNPGGRHPAARVIRSGAPILLERMTDQQLTSFAEGSEHAKFMIERHYHSAVVAPLVARGRTLGALSVLRLGDGETYSADDLELACELARRAALAIDNARLFSEVRQVEQRLEAILVNLAEAILLTDEQQQIAFANQAAADLFGARSPAEMVGTSHDAVMRRFVMLDEQGRELAAEQLPRQQLFSGQRAQPLLFRSVHRDTGEERWLVVRSSPITDPESGRALYAVSVYEDITEVKRTQLTEAFMAEASRVLSSSLDYTSTLQRIVRLAVPQIADGCAVDVLNEAGEIERVAVHHRDPEVTALLSARLSRGQRHSLDELTGVSEVIRNGKARILTDITPDKLAAYVRDEEQRQLLRAIKATAVIIAPLAAPTRTIGALTLVSSESTRRLSRADLTLAVRLGRRAGTAVESARLYTERTRIASILQAALLPESLPEIPKIEVQARYRAAGELNDVGGDFYDVFPCGEDRWILAIGDVCGKGPRAAGVTALARHTLRTAAKLQQTLRGMLGTLHEALRSQSTAVDLCTVCLVALEPGRGCAHLSVALAGHPPPLLISAQKEPRQLGVPGTLLGVLDELEITETEAELRRGQTLVLYTDGLTEAGHPDKPLGEQGLIALCDGASQLTLDDLLARIEDAALQRAEGELGDDIALLACRPAG